MKRRQDQPEDDEPLLFDLPLSTGAGGPSPVELDEEPPLERKRPAPPARERRPLRSGPVPVPDLEDEAGEDLVAEEAGEGFAGRGRRLAAGLADLLIHAALAVVAVLGVRALHVRPAVSEWPAFAAFVVTFSFLYYVLPLAFWGHTPGMAWAGITSHNRDGEALTFDQTARRWLGGFLTTALLGLPLLVMIGGRSLADLISGSVTYVSAGPED